MSKKISIVLSVFVLVTASCFGQQNDVVFLEPQKAQQHRVDYQPV